MNRKPATPTRATTNRSTSRKEAEELRRQLDAVTARQNELKKQLHRLDVVTTAEPPRAFSGRPAAAERQRSWTLPSEDEDEGPRYRRTRMQERMEKRQRSYQAMVALGLVALAFALGTWLIHEMKRHGML